MLQDLIPQCDLILLNQHLNFTSNCLKAALLQHVGAPSHISVKLESKELFKGIKSSSFHCNLLVGQTSDIEQLIIEETV